MECNCSTSSEYFTDANLLSLVPQSMLYLAAVYTTMIVLGLYLVKEKPKNEEHHMPEDQEKLSKTFHFLWYELFQSRDFWFLFMTR